MIHNCQYEKNDSAIGANSSGGVIGCLRLSGVSNVIIQNLNITNPSGLGTGDGVEVSARCTYTIIIIPLRAAIIALVLGEAFSL